jgi:hypothetical protein
VSEKELEYFDWVRKISEKITLVLIKVHDHTDITEEDYSVLEVLHRTWCLGHFSLYQTKMEGKNEKTCQTDLFLAQYNDETTDCT